MRFAGFAKSPQIGRCDIFGLHILRDGTALLQLASGLRHLVRGWDRMGIAVYSLQLIVYSLRLISWLFADNLQISCDFLGGFEEKV